VRIAALLLIAIAACAQQAPKAKPPGEDWVSLFNGKDLTGWVEVGKEKWVVEEGTIHGIAITKEYGYLQTGKPYKDFHLSLKFKCEGDGNSGVFFHTAFKPGTPDITQGLQFEVDCTIGQHTGGIYGDGRGWVVWPAPENETVVRKGEWNEYLLKVEGNRYIARLNGVVMIDFTDPRPKSFDGPIALQLHSGGQGDMRFKDILIRDLSHR
jgi:hypothetical protein